MRISMLTLCLCATLTLAACKKEEPAVATPPATTPATTPAATTPTTTPAPTPAPVASGDAIGVAECDEYLTKYEACLTGKVPESARAALQQSLDATRAGWKQAAASPGGAEGLKSACEQMVTAARQSMQAYGCTDF